MSIAKVQAMRARMEEDKVRTWRRIKDQRVNKRVFRYEINVARTEKKVVKSATFPGNWLKTFKSNQVIIYMSAGAYHGVFLNMVTKWQEVGEFEEGRMKCRLEDVDLGITMEKAVGVDMLIRIKMKEDSMEEQEVTIHCYNLKAKILVQSKGATKFVDYILEPKMLKAIDESREEIDGMNEEVVRMAVEKRKREHPSMVGSKFKCEHCSKFFNRKKEMVSHMKSPHLLDSASVIERENYEKDLEPNGCNVEVNEDTLTETVKTDDKAEILADHDEVAKVADEDGNDVLKADKTNDDKAEISAEKEIHDKAELVSSENENEHQADGTKPNMDEKIETMENMVKETVEDVLKSFGITGKNIGEEEKKTTEKPTKKESKKEKSVDVNNPTHISPKVTISKVTIEDVSDDEEEHNVSKTKENTKEPLKIGKNRENPVKPSVETVAACSHPEDTGFICERCELKCISVAELLHHVTESHEEGSMTNFLIYNLTEDNRQIKEDMKNMQLSLEFLMRDNQHLQRLNMETAVKLEAALIVNQKKEVKINENENHDDEDGKEKVTKNKETSEPTNMNEEKDWIVLDEYDETKNVKVEEVLWIGTSLSNEHLDERKASLKTNTNVKKAKAFTVVRKDGKYNPDLNVEDVAKKELEEKPYDVVVVEVGVNEVSNLDLRKNPHLLRTEMKEKIEKLHLLAVQWTEKYPGMKVVLLEMIERIDSDKRANQATGSNQAMHAIWEANGSPKNIIIEKLNLKTKKREERDEVFGMLGRRTSNGRLCDGIHLRGSYGRREFTHRAARMMMKVLGSMEAKVSKEVPSDRRATTQEMRVQEEARIEKETKIQKEARRHLNEVRRKQEVRRTDELRRAWVKRRQEEDKRIKEEEWRKANVRRENETIRIYDMKKRAEEKKLIEEKKRREDIIKLRKEESKRRVKENKMKDDERRKRTERMRRSDYRQQRDENWRQDYEKRKAERERRHAKREKEERVESEKRESKNEYFRSQVQQQRRNVEEPRNDHRWYMDREGRSEEEGRQRYYQDDFPRLPRAGNGRWGAPAPRWRA